MNKLKLTGEIRFIKMIKSNKQKKQEILKNRQKKADQIKQIKTNYLPEILPNNAVLADHEQLRKKN